MNVKLALRDKRGRKAAGIDRGAVSVIYHGIDIPYDRIAKFCQRHNVRTLSLFGSILRDDFTPDSDIDVLIEFEPGETPGLAFFAMERELSALIGWRVDLNTPNCLSRYYRDEVMSEAKELSDAA